MTMSAEKFYRQTDDSALGEIDSPEQERVCFAWMDAYARYYHAERSKGLVEALTEILDRFPSPEIVEELRADVGYGYRNYSTTLRDGQLVKYRAALTAVKEGM